MKKALPLKAIRIVLLCGRDKATCDNQQQQPAAEQKVHATVRLLCMKGQQCINNGTAEESMDLLRDLAVIIPRSRSIFEFGIMKGRTDLHYDANELFKDNHDQ